MNLEHYIPIQSLDLHSEAPVAFDVYLNLPLNNRLILLRRAGEVLQTSRVEAFAEKNVSYFYIHKKDYKAYVKYISNRLYQLIGKDLNVSQVESVQRVAKALLGSTFQVETPSMAQALMANLTDIAKSIVEESIMKEDSLQKKTFLRFYEMAQQGTDFQKHPVHVASLSVLMTFGIGYTNPKILSDIAMAGILHDVGFVKLAPKLARYEQVDQEFSNEELAQIQRHPILSLEVVKEKGIQLSEMAKTIILQHHECFNGRGYPYGTRGYYINELAQVLRVADELDRLVHIEPKNSATSLKVELNDLFFKLHREKIIEPSLMTRLRGIF